MNILYISHLTNSPWAGPSYSVPAQIEAQSHIDNVFWYNISNSEKAKEWKHFPYYHDSEEFPEQRLNLLPKPFDKPDIVVVEQFYNMAKCPILKELENGNIPYVIIPRCELTKEAQKRKRLKKLVANKLYFEKFSRNAAAIHYLTEQERLSSGEKWNKKSFVVPNGVSIQKKGEKKFFSSNSIRCISIGRIEPYQKGLDLLIKATALVQVQLRNANVTIDLYGPDVDNKSAELKQMIDANDVGDIISIYDPVFGDDKIRVLEGSDVFLMPSRFEGHPMSMIEALAFGLPCIATPGSNMYEEIKKNDAGWCSECSINSISNTLVNMIDEKNQIQKKSSNALALASAYSWNSIAMNSHNEYEKILGERV